MKRRLVIALGEREGFVGSIASKGRGEERRGDTLACCCRARGSVAGRNSLRLRFFSFLSSVLSLLLEASPLFSAAVESEVESSLASQQPLRRRPTKKRGASLLFHFCALLLSSLHSIASSSASIVPSAFPAPPARSVAPPP